MFLEKVLATFCRSVKFKRSHKFIQSFEFIRSTKGCLNLFQKRDLHLKQIEDFQNIAKTIGLHSELLSRYFLCQIFEPLLPLSNFWVFLIIAQNGVLTPESLSTGQCVAMPLKISFLQNKNISVVAKQCKKIISVPMSYIAFFELIVASPSDTFFT